MRTMRLAALGLWVGLISGFARVEDFVPRLARKLQTEIKYQGKRLSVVLTLTLLVGLAGCKIGPGSLFGNLSTCTSNCSPPPPAPEFLYATSPNHVLSFTINPTSGALSASEMVAGPNQSTGLAWAAPGFLYVSDFWNDAVDGFSINSSSGGLTALADSPFSLGGAPPGAGGLSMFIDNDTYLYATDLNAGTVAGFSYNSTNGMLTPVPGSPFPASNTPVQAVQAQAGGSLFLYVSNLNDSAGGISAFTINASNGALSPIPGSPFPTGVPGSFPGPSAMTVSVDNNFLYVALAGTANANNQIVAFSIDPTTGSLTALPGSPYTTGNDPLQMAYVPITAGLQSFLYTANVQDDTISAFTVDHMTGALTPVNGSPYASGKSVGGLAVGPLGIYFLYAADPQSETVVAYAIDGTTGALTPLVGSPFTAGSAPMLLTILTP